MYQTNFAAQNTPIRPKNAEIIPVRRDINDTNQPGSMRERARLLHRIRLLKYQTVEKTLQIDSLQIRFLKIANPDVVLDRVAEEQDKLERLRGVRTDGDQLRLPYWAELWDSAAAIGQFLVRSRSMPPLSILDLGCGMGLAGTVAARLGHRVLFADLEPPALLFARINSLPDAERVRTRRTNWRTDHLGERFDLIIGADILYERTQWEFLEPFWREHLAADGTVLLGEPGRQTGDLFPEWIRTRGWLLREFKEVVSTRPTPIRVFELIRAPGLAT
jgi:predicted nicotinamide N-methyase